MQEEPCPDCGFDPTLLLDDELADALVREAAEWGRTLASADPRARRRRPAPDTWSPLEYACHVRDVLPVMAARIERMLGEDDPELGWWDHEAEADLSSYNDQDPVHVVEDLAAHSRAFAACLGPVRGEQWDRPGRRRAGERFTVRGVARFVLHEAIHHREDAVAGLEAAAGADEPEVDDG